jgi:DNA mismatch repair ATPase MutL
MGQTAEVIADGKIPGENNEPSIIEKIQNPAEDINIDPEKLQELQEQYKEVLEKIKNNIDNAISETAEESINDVAEEAVENTASKMETKTVSDAAKASIEMPSGNGLPTWAKIGIAAAGVIAVGSLIKNKDKKEKEAPRQNLNTKMAMHPMYSPSNYTNNDQQLAQGISRYRYGRTG